MKGLIRRVKNTRLFQKYGQFLQFCIVGGTNFLISTLTYSGLLLLFDHFPNFMFTADSHTDLGIKVQIANIVAFGISVLNAYVLNRIWVFRKEAKTASKGTALRFFGSYGFSFLLSTLLAWAWVSVFHFEKYLVPFVNVLITTPLNFFLSKYFTFRAKKHAHPANEIPDGAESALTEAGSKED